jgi:hypothetical protein
MFGKCGAGNAATGYLFPATQCTAKQFKFCNRFAVDAWTPPLS